MLADLSFLEVMALVCAGVYGLWPFFPLAALRNVLEGRGKLRAQVRKIPRNLMFFWALFALCRLVMFVKPEPILLQFVPEPMGTYLFFTAGSVCLLLWWTVDRHGEMPRLSPQAQPAPVASFPMPVPASVAAPVCPKCRVPMVERTARQGKYQGQKFYGCPNSPSCRETRAL